MIDGIEEKKFLVCDTDKESLEKFCDVLQRIGVPQEHLICTTDLHSALKIVTDEQVDVIFLDLSVKQSNGYSICSFLETVDNFCDIPVVLTAYPENGIGPLRAVAMRGRGYISKPIQMLSLQRKLQTIFREQELEELLKVPIDDGCSCCGAR